MYVPGSTLSCSRFYHLLFPSMPWPLHIITSMFESIPAGGLAGATDEAMLYGPINMLLVHLFPPTDLYIVSPCMFSKKLLHFAGTLDSIIAGRKVTTSRLVGE